MIGSKLAHREFRTDHQTGTRPARAAQNRGVGGVAGGAPASGHGSVTEPGGPGEV
jgi:hypothetical protein